MQSEGNRWSGKVDQCFAIDVLKFLCGDFGEGNDKCDKIIDQTPRSILKKLSKSPLTLIIDILQSL